MTTLIPQYDQGTTNAVNRPFNQKLAETISVKDFGALGNGIANDSVAVQNAWNAVKSSGGGILYFPPGTYLINITGLGSDNVSLLGTGTASIINSYAANSFAVKYDGGYPAYGLVIKDLVFSDASNAQTKQGLYINVGSNVYFDNVTFNGFGIGLCLNGTIENTFVRCNFTYNYCGVFDTTSTGSDTSITNVNGQTVTITNAFQTIHSGLQGYYDCNWYINNVHYYFEQPDNAYTSEGALKFIGGSSEGGNCGFYLSAYTFHPCVFDGIWFENSLSTTVALRSLTLPAQNIYVANGNVNIKNTAISAVTASGQSVVSIEDCDFIEAPVFTANNNAAFVGKNILGAIGSANFYIDGARNVQSSRQFSFYTTSKSSLSRPYSDFLAFSNACRAADSLLTAYGSSTITHVTSDSVFTPTESNQVVAPSTSGIVSSSYTIDNTKIYVMTIALKSLGSAFNLSFSSNSLNTTLNVQPTFTTFAVVGSVTGPSGSDSFIVQNQSGSSQTFLVSGWQLLAFNDWGQVYEFLKSNSFNLA
jgi:hypothetical protein